MLTLYGAAVSAENARRLVASLIADGSADALDAAETIAYAVSRGCHAVAVAPAMRNAILATLENPSAGLEDLRSTLARDHRDRKDREV